MPANAVVLARQLAAAGTTVPRWLDARGGGSERMRRFAIAHVNRIGNTGQIQIFGADIANADMGDQVGGDSLGAQVFKSVAGTATYQSQINYAAFSNYNWILIQWVAGKPNIVPHAAGAGNWQVSDVGGKALVTLGTAPTANGQRLELHRVTPVELYDSTDADGVAVKEIASKALAWVVATGGTVSATDVTVTPIAR